MLTDAASGGVLEARSRWIHRRTIVLMNGAVSPYGAMFSRSEFVSALREGG